MARVTLTPKVLPATQKIGSNIAAGSADFTFTAADVIDYQQFACTGKEYLLVRNDNVAAKTVTIYGLADEFNRSGNITAYSVGASETAIFGPFNPDCFRQTDGYVYVDTNSVDIMLAVLRVP